jgi:hypothetical protein
MGNAGKVIEGKDRTCQPEGGQKVVGSMENIALPHETIQGDREIRTEEYRHPPEFVWERKNRAREGIEWRPWDTALWIGIKKLDLAVSLSGKESTGQFLGIATDACMPLNARSKVNGNAHDRSLFP